MAVPVRVRPGYFVRERFMRARARAAAPPETMARASTANSASVVASPVCGTPR